DFICSTISLYCIFFFFFSSRRRHTRSKRDWSSDVCSSDLLEAKAVDDDTAAGSPGDAGADGRDFVVDTDTLRVVPVVLIDVVERSEERRVGKECGCGWWREQYKENGEEEKS